MRNHFITFDELLKKCFCLWPEKFGFDIFFWEKRISTLKSFKKNWNVKTRQDNHFLSTTFFVRGVTSDFYSFFFFKMFLPFFVFAFSHVHSHSPSLLWSSFSLSLFSTFLLTFHALSLSHTLAYTHTHTHYGCL